MTPDLLLSMDARQEIARLNASRDQSKKLTPQEAELIRLGVNPNRG